MKRITKNMDGPNVLTWSHIANEERKTNNEHIFLKTPRKETGCTPKYMMGWNNRKFFVQCSNYLTSNKNRFTNIKYPNVLTVWYENPVIKKL